MNNIIVCPQCGHQLQCPDLESEETDEFKEFAKRIYKKLEELDRAMQNGLNSKGK